MFGLQRLKYNGKPTFEILATKSKPNGFEIEFMQPVENIHNINSSDFFLEQSRYQPTANYGGPKLDLEQLKPSRMELNADNTRMYLEIPGLKKEHVFYFQVPENLLSIYGMSLLSSEACYTLNTIPLE